jgi:hypothetical protein
MIPTAPFTPVGVTMSQCPIKILDCRLNSRILLFHWSLTPTGVKGTVGIIFDISQLIIAVWIVTQRHNWDVRKAVDYNSLKKFLLN